MEPELWGLVGGRLQRWRGHLLTAGRAKICIGAAATTLRSRAAEWDLGGWKDSRVINARDYSIGSYIIYAIFAKQNEARGDDVAAVRDGGAALAV